MQPVGDGDDAPSVARPRWFRTSRLMIAVAVLAFLVRLIPILTSKGGLRFYGRYDDGVYYAASDALIHGRLPYRDFVLLHPPGLMLALTPFALLGRLTSDPTGMSAARLAFMAVGAVNTVLVCALALRWGRRPAVVAGLIYACWLSAVYSEQSTLLEPLGGAAVLVALLLLVKSTSSHPGRNEVLAGVALGLACVFKIWYVAPLGALIGCVLLARRFRTALRLGGGAAVTASVICLPFFILAPVKMWDMVVRDQLLRRQPATSRFTRLSSIVGVRRLLFSHATNAGVFAGVILLVILLATAVCFTDRDARVIAVVLVVNFAVLLASPSYFAHYAVLIAAPSALVIGISIERISSVPSLATTATALTVALVGVSLLSAARIVTTPDGLRFPAHVLSAAAPPGCIAADDPQALIQLNRLSSDLAAGCRVPVDVTGTTYDSLRDIGADGRPLPRSENLRFQDWLVRYLTSAAAYVLIRRVSDASPPAIRAELDAGRPLARHGRIVLRQGSG